MTRETRLRIALGLNVVIVVIQVIAGFAAHSLGLLADAGHNLTDVAAVIISLIAVRMATRPATAQRSFGWHRSTILAAQANAALILGVTAFITIEAIGRLRDPEPVETGIVIAIAALAMVGNTLAALILFERGGKDLNMRSAVLHMISDAAASFGVLVSAVVMAVVGGAYWLDPLMSLLISGFIAWRSIKLLAETAEVLLESTPADLDVEAMADAMVAVPGVESVHDLHVWSLSSELRALAAHLVLEGHPTLEEAQVVGERVKHHIGDQYAIAHATLELECEPCATHVDPCLDVDPQQAAAGHHGHAH